MLCKFIWEGYSRYSLNNKVTSSIVIIILSVIGLFLAQTQFFGEVTITP
jgi:hypothetical protein